MQANAEMQWLLECHREGGIQSEKNLPRITKNKVGGFPFVGC